MRPYFRFLQQAGVAAMPKILAGKPGDTYQELVAAIRKSVKEPMTDEEAHEAARNLIGFGRTLLEIHRQMRQDSRYVEKN